MKPSNEPLQPNSITEKDLDIPDSSTAQQDPFTVLIQMAGGYCLSRSLHVVASMGVADLLDDTPLAVDKLAKATGTHTDALQRILRLLAAHGVFELNHGMVAHTPASQLLRADHPQSAQALAQMFGLSVNWQIYEQLEYTLKTGRPAAEKVIPEGFWQYYGTHPEENAIFNAAMASKAHAQVNGIVANYNFSMFNTIGDIGGGRGHLLSAILNAVPKPKGVLFDLPHVIAEVQSLASERLILQPGDFFKDLLPACDAYVLMEIIHDWPDLEAVSILKAIRRASPAKAKLLLIEQIMPEKPGPHWSKTLDIHMLTLLGGRQRTLKEYEVLLEQSGFSYTCEVNTFTGISIIEAVAV